jgi:hypothetical protein
VLSFLVPSAASLGSSSACSPTGRLRGLRPSRLACLRLPRLLGWRSSRSITKPALNQSSGNEGPRDSGVSVRSGLICGTAPTRPIPANGYANVRRHICLRAGGCVCLCTRWSSVGNPDLDLLWLLSDARADESGCVVDGTEASREEVCGPVAQRLRPEPELIVEFGRFQSARWYPQQQLGCTDV